MARDGYLILDSDLHMMEPDDLWARYLEGPHRASLPRFFGGQQQKLSESSEDKGHADTIMGMEVAGLAIPAHGKAAAATASSRELRRRSRARHPHFQVARGRGFDPESTLTAMDIEGVDVAVMYGTRGRQILCHDDLAPDYAAALARAYNNWAYDYCKSHPARLKFAAQVAMHSIPAAVEEARRCVRELGAVAIIGTPNPVNGQHLHDEACEPLWSAPAVDAAERVLQAAVLHRARRRRGAGRRRRRQDGRRLLRRVHRLSALRRRVPGRDEGVLRAAVRRRGPSQDPVGQLRAPLQHRHAGGALMADKIRVGI